VNYWVIGGSDAAACVSASVSVAAWAVVSSTCVYLAGLLIAECIFPFACAETGIGTLSPKMESVGHDGAVVISSSRTTAISSLGGVADFVSGPKKASGANGAGEMQNDCPGGSGDAPEADHVVPLLVRDLDHHPGCIRLAHEEAVGIGVACV
jgi:hypothetical protein